MIKHKLNVDRKLITELRKKVKLKKASVPHERYFQ